MIQVSSQSSWKSPAFIILARSWTERNFGSARISRLLKNYKRGFIIICVLISVRNWGVSWKLCKTNTSLQCPSGSMFFVIEIIYTWPLLSMQANRQTALAEQLRSPKVHSNTWTPPRLAMNIGVKIMTSHQVLVIASESLRKLLNARSNQNSFSYKEDGIMHTVRIWFCWTSFCRR